MIAGNVVSTNTEVVNLTSQKLTGIILSSPTNNYANGVTDISNSTFSGLSDNIYIKNFTSIQLKNNTFRNIGGYALANYSTKDVTATENYFELPQGKNIDNILFDSNDDLRYGKINYQPLLTSPAAGALSTPTNVYKLTNLNGVSVTWNKSSNANVKGYKIYWGGTDAFSYSNSVEVDANTNSYIVKGISLAERIAVTAISNNATGNNDQLNGAESWFAAAVMPVPTVQSFTPVSAAAGTSVTITGTNMDATTDVMFGGVSASSFTINSPTSVTAIVGNGASGSVKVGNSAGSTFLPGFNYIIAPVVNSFSPSAAIPGSKITITGSYFSGTTAVSIGGVAAASFQVISSSSIVAVTAPGAKSGDVSVVNPAGTANLGGFIVVDPPSISYSGPQTYIAGKAITPLSPQNTGGLVNGNTTENFAGSGTIGFADGKADVARFYNPWESVFDGAGNMYVADYSNHRIRKITPDGVVSTFAGSGTYGNTNGNGALASFNSPTGLAIDKNGNIYVADRGNNVIRKITPSGDVSTFAGSGNYGSIDQTGLAASFAGPNSIVIDGAGNLFVSEFGGGRIRKVSPSGLVMTFVKGLYSPMGLAMDKTGNIYVAENGAERIAKITPSGVIIPFAGSGSANPSTITSPKSLAIDENDNLYVADRSISTVRKISTAGIVSTLPGLNFNSSPSTGFTPLGLTYNNKILYVNNESVIKKIYLSGYSATPSLPDGLKLDEATGVISGTATEGLPSNDFTITGTNIAGSSSAKINITIVTPPPAITSFGPMLATSGTKITINGTFLGGTTAVSIGGVPAGSFTIVSANVITATVAPAAKSGSVNLTNANGSATLNGFEYGEAPAISYSTPQTFVAGNAINTLTPQNSGGAIPAAVYATTTTFAGSGLPSTSDASGTSASFYNPSGVASDSQGNLYVADQLGNKIRKITPAGVVTTLAGNGSSGYADGNGTTAMFSNPCGVAVGQDGNIYVADRYNNRIRKITPAGFVTTFAGDGSANTSNNTGTLASFNYPYGITAAADGNLYVADQLGNIIRKITMDGRVTTLAGNGNTGTVNGTGSTVSFNRPTGLVADDNGNIFVAENGGNVIRKINSAGTVSTVAGSGTSGFVNGNGTQAYFSQPTGITIDLAGNLYVADQGTSNIRIISPDGNVSSIAGSWTGNSGQTNGVGTTALFNRPTGVAYVAGKLYVADYSNNLIRSIVTTGFSISPALPGGLVFNNQTGAISGTPSNILAATDYKVTATNALGSSTATINIAIASPPAPNIAYDKPTDFSVGKSITPLIPKNTGGPVNYTTNTGVFTGAGSGSGFADGDAAVAKFSAATGLTVDNAGNMYVADAYNNRIRKVTSDGTVSTLAGNGNYAGNNGAGTSASFANPSGVAVDAAGNVYVADRYNYRIRKITPAGVVSTFAGNGTASSVDGTSTTSSFRDPRCITIDAVGNLYVSESSSGAIRKIDQTGSVKTIATGLINPLGLALDAAGNLFVAESGYNQIRKITPSGSMSIFVSNASADPLGRFTSPKDITIDPAGNLYVIDQSNYVARKVSADGVVSALPGFTPAASPTTSFFANGIVYANNKLYISEDGRIRSVALFGYNVMPALPSGLSLDAATGTVSGSPNVASKTTEYTVTATNLGGSSSAKISFATTGGPLITFDPMQAITYGDAPVNVAATSTVTVTPILYTSSNTGVANVISGKLYALSAGSTIITASQTGAADVRQTVTVNPKALNIAATASSKFYGNADPVLAYTLPSGSLVGTDVLSGALTRDAGESAGTYAIKNGTLTGGSNYKITFTTADFVVNPRVITVTGTDASKTYGETDPVFSYTVNSGLLLGNDTFTGKISRAAGENAGQYEMQKGTLAINNNYLINFNRGTFTINKKNLTVTAEDKARMQGKTNPGFTVVYEGFANGDNSGKLSTQPVVSTTASLASPTGIYDLVPANGSADNYVFIYKNGKLTVNAATNNFKVAAVNVSCKGQNNGSINITPGVSASYTAVLTGNNINRSAPFNNGTTFDNLAPGAYNVCITDAALPGRPQCFDIVISEPKDLSVYASTDKASGLLTLALAGGSNYNVTLNGEVYKTSSSSISVPLQSGSNKVTVTTDQPCQGTFEEFYVQTDKQLPYPNPFQEVIYVNLGEDVIGKVAIKLYDVSSGALKLNQQFTAQSGVVRLDAAELAMGVYSMHLIMDGKEKVYKLIKK